jgi:CubicO group peptidase (beta-lactamase class C family)
VTAHSGPTTITRRVLLLGAATVALLAAACSTDAGSGAGAAGGTATTDDDTTTTTTAVTYDFSEVAAQVDAAVAAKGLNGAGLVIVDRDRGVVFEHYDGEFDAERISLVASASKMLTAGVLMRLDDQGLLDVDAPVAEVTDWGAAHPDITPAQLVSNSSGLIGLIDRGGALPYGCQYVAAGTLQDCARTIFTTPGDDGRVIPPDTEFRYGGGQWQVAGAVAEAASGRTWDELVRDTYVEPCGVDSLGYANHFTELVSERGPFSYPTAFVGDPATLSPTDNPNMEGGAYITPPDYAALLLMHLRGGTCGDERVLSEESVDRMHADRIGPTYGGTTDFELEGYGLGWWVDRDDPDHVQDAGAFGAVPWLDLGRGYGAYLVVEDQSRTGSELARQIKPLIDAEFDRTDPPRD